MSDISKINAVELSSLSSANSVSKSSIDSIIGVSIPAGTVSPTIYYDAKNASSYSGSGTSWYDLGAGNYTMLLRNGPVFNSTPPKHFDFDGVNDYAYNNSSGPQIFGGSDAYSFEAWVRLDGLLSTTSTTPIYSIASKSPTANGVPGWKWTLRSGSYNGMMMRMGDSGGGTVDLTPTSSSFLTAINDTTNFHQVVITIDESSSTAFIYADGTQYTVATNGFSGGSLGNSRNTSSNMSLSRYGLSTSFEFKGDISEFAVYDKALSQAEVTALYNAKSGNY